MQKQINIQDLSALKDISAQIDVLKLKEEEPKDKGQDIETESRSDDDDEYEVEETIPQSMKTVMNLQDLSALEDLTAQMETFEMKEEEQLEQEGTREKAKEMEMNSDVNVNDEDDDDDEYEVEEMVPEAMKKIMDLTDLSALEDLTAQMETFEMKEEEQTEQADKPAVEVEEKPEIEEHEAENGDDDDDEYEVEEIVPEAMKNIMDLKDLSALEDLTAQMETFEMKEEEQTEQVDEPAVEEKPVMEEHQLEDEEDDDDEYEVDEVVPESMKKIMDMSDLSALEDLTAQMETFEMKEEEAGAQQEEIQDMKHDHAPEKKEDDEEDDDDEYEVEEMVPEAMKKIMDLTDLSALEDLTAQMETFEMKEEEQTEQADKPAVEVEEKPEIEEHEAEDGDDDDDEYEVEEIVPEAMKNIMDLKDLSALEDLTAQMETFEMKEEEQTEQVDEPAIEEKPEIEEHQQGVDEDEDDDDEYEVDEVVPESMKKIMDLSDLSALEDLTAQMETFEMKEEETQEDNRKVIEPPSNINAETTNTESDEDDEEFSDPGLIPEHLKKNIDPADLGFLEDMAAFTGQTTIMEPQLVQTELHSNSKPTDLEENDRESDDEEYADPGLIPEQLKSRLSPEDLGFLEDLTAAAGQTTIMEPQPVQPEIQSQTNTKSTDQDEDDGDDEEYSDPGLIPEQLKGSISPEDLGFLEDLTAAAGQTTIMEAVQAQVDLSPRQIQASPEFNDDVSDDDDEYSDPGLILDSMKHKMNPADLGFLEDLTAAAGQTTLMEAVAASQPAVEESSDDDSENSDPGLIPEHMKQIMDPADLGLLEDMFASEAFDGVTHMVPDEDVKKESDNMEEEGDEYTPVEYIPEGLKKRMSAGDLGVLEDLAATAGEVSLMEREQRDEHEEEDEDGDDEYADPGLIPDDIKRGMNPIDLGFLEDLVAVTGQSTVMSPAPSETETDSNDDDDEFSDPGLIPEQMKQRIDPADLGFLEDLTARAGQTTIMTPIQEVPSAGEQHRLPQDKVETTVTPDRKEDRSAQVSAREDMYKMGPEGGETEQIGDSEDDDSYFPKDYLSEGLKKLMNMNDRIVVQNIIAQAHNVASNFVRNTHNQYIINDPSDSHDVTEEQPEVGMESTVSRRMQINQRRSEVTSLRSNCCRHARDSGPCKARLLKWYYDAEEKKCLPFAYGGCGGNKNRFRTKELCEHRCLRMYHVSY